MRNVRFNLDNGDGMSDILIKKAFVLFKPNTGKT